MSNNWTSTGILPISIREAYHCGDSYWSDNGFSLSTGHRYLALNSLGASSKTPQQVASLVMSNLGAVFPGGATGSDGSAVRLNNVFSLGIMRFKVRVVAVDLWSFTLRTEPWHILIGTARHGIVKDSTGEMWLIQEGIGEASRESMMNLSVNYLMAPGMWRDMAANIRRQQYP